MHVPRKRGEVRRGTHPVPLMLGLSCVPPRPACALKESFTTLAKTTLCAR